jgi:hypothetical protein
MSSLAQWGGISPPKRSRWARTKEKAIAALSSTRRRAKRLQAARPARLSSAGGRARITISAGRLDRRGDGGAPPISDSGTPSGRGTRPRSRRAAMFQAHANNPTPRARPAQAIAPLPRPTRAVADTTTAATPAAAATRGGRVPASTSLWYTCCRCGSFQRSPRVIRVRTHVDASARKRKRLVPATTTACGRCPAGASRGRAARAKPTTPLPASPRNTDAGAQL